MVQHFIRKLYKVDRNLKIIPQTEEKYFSISVKVEATNIQFEFKDSYKFLHKSIDKSAKVLYELTERKGTYLELTSFLDSNGNQ
jgi:hypothetical protein